MLNSVVPNIMSRTSCLKYFHFSSYLYQMIRFARNCVVCFSTLSGSLCFLAIVFAGFPCSGAEREDFSPCFVSPSYLLLYPILQTYTALLALIVLS